MIFKLIQCSAGGTRAPSSDSTGNLRSVRIMSRLAILVFHISWTLEQIRVHTCIQMMVKLLVLGVTSVSQGGVQLMESLSTSTVLGLHLVMVMIQEGGVGWNLHLCLVWCLGPVFFSQWLPYVSLLFVLGHQQWKCDICTCIIQDKSSPQFTHSVKSLYFTQWWNKTFFSSHLSSVYFTGVCHYDVTVILILSFS